MAPPLRYPKLHDRDWMLERAQAGDGLTDVARLLGCSPAAVHRAARKVNVTFTERAASRHGSAICPTCDLSFTKTSGVQRFCSPACRAGGLDDTCEHCGDAFQHALTSAKAKGLPARRYCSTRCRNLAVFGKEAARSITKKGYVRITTPDGRSMMEHRYVMENILNRPLKPGETVHHKNDIRHDNSPGNLQLRRGNHGPGAVFQCQDCGSHNVEAMDL